MYTVGSELFYSLSIRNQASPRWISGAPNAMLAQVKLTFRSLIDWKPHSPIRVSELTLTCEHFGTLKNDL